MGNKRIYLGREVGKYAEIAGGSIITITALFFVLMVLGLEITGSDDYCLGTPENPCVSYGQICNLGPNNYDIYNPESIKIDFSPEIQEYWIFFKDGRVKKEFLIPKGISHSTAGWRFENFTNATKPRKDRVYTHRFARYSCQDYMIVGLKENPDDIVKWGFGVGQEYLDPFWYGVNTTIANISASGSLNLELGSLINISANLSGISAGFNWTDGTLVAYWNMSSTMATVNATDYNITRVGTPLPTFVSYGILNDSLNLTHGSGSARVWNETGDELTLNQSGLNFTISFWYNMTGGGTQTFIADRYSFGWWIQYNNPTVQKINILGMNGPMNMTSLSNVSMHQWEHFVLTKNSSHMCLFLNGSMDNCTATVGDVHGWNAFVRLTIGAETDNSVNFKGQMDEVAIFHRALSASEVGTLYNDKKALGYGEGEDSRVCVDIDHPDYGDEYTCGTSGTNSVNFLFNISWFRNNEFNDSSTTKNISWVDGGNQTVHIRQHQYDEIINASINLTGYISNGTSPENINIYINDTLFTNIGEVSNDLTTTDSVGGDHPIYSNTSWNSSSITVEGSCTVAPCANVSDRYWDTPATPADYTNITINYTIFEDSISANLTMKIDNVVDISNLTRIYCYDDASLLLIDTIPETTDIINVTFEVPTACFYDETELSIRYEWDNTGTELFYESEIKWYKSGKILDFTDTVFNEIKGFNINISCFAVVSSAYWNVTGEEYKNALDQRMNTNYSGEVGLIQQSTAISQTFKPSYSNQTKIELLLYSGNPSHSGPITIKLGTTINGSEINYTSIPSSDIQSTAQWIEIDFDNNLTIGEIYYITLNASSSDLYYWQRSPTDVSHYADGHISVLVFGVIANLTNDFNFRTYIRSYPNNITLEIGNPDGTYEWNYTGKYSISQRTDDLSGVINNSLTNFSSSYSRCSVPVYVTSKKVGSVLIEEIEINYTANPNPVYLDIDLISSFFGNSSGFANMSLKFETDKNGTLQINDIRFDYAGGNDSIEVFVYEENDRSNNDTLNLINYYSLWDFIFPLHINWLEFIPRSPTAKNVTPYGQTPSRPIFNITTYNYGGKNMNLTIFSDFPTLGCYQEHANVSTSCGGFSTGEYTLDSQMSINAIDGNWSTYSTGPTDDIINGTIIYQKPVFAINGTKWQVKTRYDFLNVSIPLSCFNYSINELSLRIQHECVGAGICSDYANFYCLNSSGYSLLYNSTLGGWIYEEAITWTQDSCVNMTYNTNSTKPDSSYIINNTWKDIDVDLEYLNNTQIWMWADYSCNSTYWRLWEPDLSIRGCCIDCICSEEIINAS